MIYTSHGKNWEHKSLIKGMEDLKLEIDKFKNKIEIIKEIFNRIIKMIEIYYKINNNIINNYNKNNRNYIKLINLNNIKNNNEHLIIELNKINNVENLDEIVKFSLLFLILFKFINFI